MNTTKEKVKSLLNKLLDDCSIEDIQYHLYVLEKVRQGLEMASTGDEIIITKNNQSLVKLVPFETSKKRDPLFGSDKDIISISDDFDEPLAEFQEYM